MRVLCVDDERKIAEYTVTLCRKLPQVDEAVYFTHSKDALAWLDENSTDVALLDIDMPDISGIELARELQKRQPQIAIIFLTGYAQYALDAFSIHASGYLMKPVTEDMLSAEIAYVASHKHSDTDTNEHAIFVQTFGGFDIFVDHNCVGFKYSKSKELLAYLVDKRGNSVTRKEAFSILWEDRVYDRPMQKQLDVIIRSLRSTLGEYGIDSIFELKMGAMRILPEMISCDAYNFFDGKVDTLDAYHGEYMSSYSWAAATEAYMTWKARLEGAKDSENP